MRGYTPRPSQTRHGQRVDNPPVELNDTGRLRVLIAEIAADSDHDQARAIAEIEKILEVNKERWQKHYQRDKELADRRDIKYLWVAIGLLAGACATVGAALFAMVRELERHK